MTESQALLIFCLEPIIIIVSSALISCIWYYVNNVKLKRQIALEDKDDGDESVANARRSELPEVGKE